MEDSLYIQIEEKFLGGDWLDSFATEILDAKYEKADIGDFFNARPPLIQKAPPTQILGGSVFWSYLQLLKTAPSFYRSDVPNLEILKIEDIPGMSSTPCSSEVRRYIEIPVFFAPTALGAWTENLKISKSCVKKVFFKV